MKPTIKKTAQSKGSTSWNVKFPVTQPPAAGEAAHTPRFSVFESRHHYGPNRLSDVIIIADGQMSVWVKQGQFNNPKNPTLTSEQQEALAAFIVRACNSHAALVEALEDCIHQFGIHWANTKPEGNALAKARAALTFAK